MVGQNIGKYRVLDRIGRGGMGTVYRAIDETLHREVAIKVLNAELNDPEVAKRFRAEAITVARLSHPGIATIYELFQHDGQWLMVMEFVRGETLERLVERSGPQLPARAAELCMQSLAALAHAHSMGVVHRDLKPANIMVTESGAIKIMDFGIARVTGTEHLTNAGFMMGTPAYMAPEQVLGHEIDARADIYAMGVVFFRLLTSQLPFKGETPFAMAQAQVNNPPTPVKTFRQDLPAWVDEVLARSLAKKPDDRFQSAVEFHEGFARSLAGQPMSAAYRSSAPPGVVTPPGAISTGSIDMTVLSGTPTSGTAAVPHTTPFRSGTVESADVAPTIASVTPVSTVRMATEPAPPPADTERVRLSGAFAADVADPPARKISPVVIGAAAALVVIVGAAAWFFMRSSPETTPSAPATTSDAAPVVSTEPAPTAPAQPAVPEPPTTKPAVLQGEVPAVGAPGGSPGAGARSGTLPGVVGATAPPAAAARGADSGRGRAGAAVPEDPLLAFTNVRYLVVDGKRARDEEILLNFVGGQIMLVDRRAGTAVAAVPYAFIESATYVKARDPKWNGALSAPPDGLDVGGILRTPKHWLTLQTTSAYIILRLEDSNFVRVIQAVEARTGRSVDRPVSSDRN